jgi:uncharacterized membrane protein
MVVSRQSSVDYRQSMVTDEVPLYRVRAQRLQMDLEGLLASLEASGLATTIRNSQLLFPLIEFVHVLGLTTVFGTIVIVDVRLLGIASTERPFSRVASDVLKWTWLAFAVTVTTGLLMFITSAGTYYHNVYFRAKMVLIVLAGINTLAFELTAKRSIQSWDRNAAAPAVGRIVAAVSLVIWIAVVCLGRWVGFSTTSEFVPGDPGIDIEELEKLLPP